MPDAGNYAATTKYQILTAAGGVSGTFDQVTIRQIFFWHRRHICRMKWI